MKFSGYGTVPPGAGGLGGSSELALSAGSAVLGPAIVTAVSLHARLLAMS